MAQARYFAVFRDKVTEFNRDFLTRPTEQITDGDGIRDIDIDLGSARGIHRAWHNAFREPNLAMRSLECTGGDGLLRLGSSSRQPSFSKKTNGISRPSSRAGSHTNLTSPPLRHTPSLTSQQSQAPTEESSSTGTGAGRRRSASFTAIQDAARSFGSESKSSGGGLGSLIRRNSRNSSSTNLSITGSLNRSMTNLSILPLNRKNSRSRRVSGTSQEERERHSFGLPRIPTNDQPLQPLFDTFIKPAPQQPQIYYPPESPSDMSFSALGFGDMQQHMDNGIPVGDSIAESWRNSPVLYTCAAVADFMPMELGNHKFQGLYFLPLVAGDLVE